MSAKNKNFYPVSNLFMARTLGAQDGFLINVETSAAEKFQFHLQMEEALKFAQKILDQSQGHGKSFWFLQDNKSGHVFWDTYLHPFCELIKTQKENPYREARK
jgi:hypothetical protein